MDGCDRKTVIELNIETGIIISSGLAIKADGKPLTILKITAGL